MRTVGCFSGDRTSPLSFEGDICQGGAIAVPEVGFGKPCNSIMYLTTAGAHTHCHFAIYIHKPQHKLMGFQDPKMEVLYHMFGHILEVYHIPLHSPYIGLIYSRYLNVPVPFLAIQIRKK